MQATVPVPDDDDDMTDLEEDPKEGGCDPVGGAAGDAIGSGPSVDQSNRTGADLPESERTTLGGTEPVGTPAAGAAFFTVFGLLLRRVSRALLRSIAYCCLQFLVHVLCFFKPIQSEEIAKEFKERFESAEHMHQKLQTTAGSIILFRRTFFEEVL
eukprot:1195704-Prorocentrum_minimum.AAC.4